MEQYIKNSLSLAFLILIGTLLQASADECIIDMLERSRALRSFSTRRLGNI